jgi:hypothetical protein
MNTENLAFLPIFCYLCSNFNQPVGVEQFVLHGWASRALPVGRNDLRTIQITLIGYPLLLSDFKMSRFSHQIFV